MAHLQSWSGPTHDRLHSLSFTIILYVLGGSVFGGTGQSVFGGQSASLSPFATQPASGQSAFGTQATTVQSAFGTQSTPNQSAFGTQQTVNQSGFGTQGTFGTQPIATGTSQASTAAPANQTTGATATNSGPKTSLYTPMEELAAAEKEQFMADKFTLGKIPTRPPPKELCF